MDTAPTRAPVLSTPDTKLAEANASAFVQPKTTSDEQLENVYEIERTVAELHQGSWRRVALQFPDDLLPDAPRVYRRLRDRLKDLSGSREEHTSLDSASATAAEAPALENGESSEVTLFILGDTSYSACCVDEIAAEHIDADVVVHYGRACLSPTARLPVVYVFTVQALDHDPLVRAFETTYHNKDEHIILAADMPYASHLPSLASQLRAKGYQNLFETTICHEPSSPIPNRTIPPEAVENPDMLREWRMFHVSEPPQALLLTLASRVSSVHIYPTKATSRPPGTLEASTALALRRRYALLMRLSRASIIGILVNTLSVHAYQAALSGTQARIAAAGKKAYVFAMGRLNSAKIANFAEVDGWVVLGCWESSLIENTDFDKPIVAPFELELALQDDKERVWTGEWHGDFSNMTTDIISGNGGGGTTVDADNEEDNESTEGASEGWQPLNSDSESEPPEFDLRTGRYITSSKPMSRKGASSQAKATNGDRAEHTLVQRAKGDLAIVGGELSPGAQFLRDKRTWRGLGSDFEIAYEDEDKDSTAIKEGRSGIARGYENEKTGG